MIYSLVLSKSNKLTFEFLKQNFNIENTIFLIDRDLISWTLKKIEETYFWSNCFTGEIKTVKNIIDSKWTHSKHSKSRERERNKKLISFWLDDDSWLGRLVNETKKIYFVQFVLFPPDSCSVSLSLSLLPSLLLVPSFSLPLLILTLPSLFFSLPLLLTLPSLFFSPLSYLLSISPFHSLSFSLPLLILTVPSLFFSLPLLLTLPSVFHSLPPLSCYLPLLLTLPSLSHSLT